MDKNIFILVILLIFQSNLFSQSESVTDIEGNIYKTVKIGNQIWMAENLRTTKLNDGTQISNVIDKYLWSKTESPAFCWENNDLRKRITVNGALYNWYTVETSKLCPVGWHVPSDRIGTSSPYIPIGYRDENGSFWFIKNSCLIWTSTPCSLTKAYHTIIYYDNSQAQRYFCHKRYGIPVRCVKD